MFITQADVIESYILGVGVLIAGVLGIARLEEHKLLPTPKNSPVET
jgi:hypothetical protein